jgi:predicted secreted protein
VSRAEVERAIASGRPVSLNGAQLAGADLTGLALARADLSYADLEGAQLDRADLRGALLWSARARSASLVGCDLRGADLQTADLTGADLRGARLVGAVLTGTTLSGALLDGAELAPDQLAGAVLGTPLDDTPERRAASGLVGGRGGGGGPSYVRLGESDDGSDVELAPGGVLEVALPEGATGYSWQLAGSAGPALTGGDSRFEPAVSDAAGAFGRRLFRFTASEPGSAVVRLRLVQPWDPEAPPAQTYSARVSVGAGS